MPPYPGEERVLTLFTDCHYYFAQPTAKPTLHRFDKASYFYIYWNSTKHTSRIEVANNAGTPDQDAFSGRLDTCRVHNSSKFPTLVTLAVDAMNDTSSPTSSKPARDPDDWYLPSADPRATIQTKYKLHTVDFYFWTQEDARLATDLFRRLLNPLQLDMAEPGQQPQSQSQSQSQPQQQIKTQSYRPGDSISPVVQNLENVAITDPAYSNGQTRDSQNKPQSIHMNIPPPPPPPASHIPNVTTTAASSSIVSPSPESHIGSGHSSQIAKTPPVNYTPIAYNPAAPAAPEKIAHREKTPPLEDDEPGVGLSTGAMHDQSQMHAYKPSQAWGAPPSVSQTTQSSQWGSPPPHPSTQSGYGSQMPPMGQVSPPPASHYQTSRTSVASGVPSFAPPPTNSPPDQNQHRHSIAAEMYTPDTNFSGSQVVETPGSQFYSTIPAHQKPLHVQPQYADYLAAGGRPVQQPPPGGYAEYSYAQGSQGGHSGHSSHSGNGGHGGHHGGHGGGNSNYDVHNQVHRPTQYEADVGSGRYSKPSRSDTGLSGKSRSLFKKFVDKAERM